MRDEGRSFFFFAFFDASLSHFLALFVSSSALFFDPEMVRAVSAPRLGAHKDNQKAR